jgi:hypothetical protein
MSWIKLHGETWPVTDDEADLRVYIHAADVGCPRVSWDLDVSHYLKTDEPPAPGSPGMDRWLDIELGQLILNLSDWRRLAELEIRADAAWHATQEFVGPYGHSYNSPRVTVHQTVLKGYAEREGCEAGRKAWIAHDFLLRLGRRDGWSFPCELDAWLIAEEEYYRKIPEPTEEAVRVPQGPPDFQLVTRANFSRAHVDLTRSAADDPVFHGRKILKEQIGCEEVVEPKLQWHLRQTPGHEKIVPMPGWRSDVGFLTPGRKK